MPRAIGTQKLYNDIRSILEANTVECAIKSLKEPQ